MLDEGGQPAAHQGAVGAQGPLAVRDRHGLPGLHLHDGPVVGHEETALGDVALQGRERLRPHRPVGSVGRGGIHALRQPADGVAELFPARSPVDSRLYVWS